MLAHVLALTVGLGSFTLYMAAFFFPEVHRKHDFFWSGLGMFYALVLWTAAGQITGAVLIGQTTSVILLGWLGWQTLVLRRVKTPLDLQTPATAESWRGFREEVTTLFQDFAAQTPVGRLLGFKRQPAGAAAGSGQVKIRASSIRDVGYEFLDDLEEPIEPARGTKAASQGAPQPVSLQRSPQPTPDSAPAPSPPQPTSTPARAKPTRPPKAA
ncbi:MAG TPA: Ycf66 family protein, partial [Leptolyngbyaceae cyanobacterium]